MLSGGLLFSCLLVVLLAVVHGFGLHGMTTYQAIASNNIAALRDLLILDKRSLNSLDGGPVDSGQTPLMFAVLSGNLEAVKVLMEAGADPTIGESQGYTPMHGAGFQGRAEIADLLINKYHLNPSDMHEDGFTPLHCACWGDEQRHTDTVRVLLDAGVHYNEFSRDGELCMDFTENEGTAALLIEYKRKTDPLFAKQVPLDILEQL
jgi:ankyrin repeat protein